MRINPIPSEKGVYKVKGSYISDGVVYIEHSIPVPYYFDGNKWKGIEIADKKYSIVPDGLLITSWEIDNQYN